MKYLYLKGIMLLTFFFIQTGAKAQSEEAVFYDDVTLDTTSQTVLLSIKTTESFIVGANRYVLHVGGATFKQSLHPDGRLDEITFLIPIASYDSVEKGTEMVLVYGYYHSNALQDGEDDQVNGFTGKHWRLGPFQPKTFTIPSTQK